MSDEIEREVLAARAQVVERIHHIDEQLNALADEVGDGQPAGRQVEVRSAPSVEVRYAERMIDIVAVPYEETTKVLYRGRMIDEVVTRGAFEGVQMRARDFSVNRAHDPERPIGWVHKFKPRDDHGLIATVGPISRTRDGDDALELAAEGLLGASVGFQVRSPADERWSVDRHERRINRAWLDHIALTGNPAYPGAKVLAVRHADDARPTPPGSPTPNLDRILAELLAEKYSRT